MIAVAMGDHRPRHRVQRIDVKIAGLAVEPTRCRLDPGRGPRRGQRDRPAVAHTRRWMAARSRIAIEPLLKSMKPALCQACSVLLTLSRLQPAILPSSRCDR